MKSIGTSKAFLAAATVASGVLLAAPASAADVSFTPPASPPYLWSTPSNWSSGALPGINDKAVLADTKLATAPLILEADTTRAISNMTVGATSSSSAATTKAALFENRGTLTLYGTLSLPGAQWATGIVTNRGTLTTTGLILGYPADGAYGTRARLDNFGTITVTNTFHMGYGGHWGWGGTPSVLHNHSGAKFTKSGGGDWTSYIGYPANGDVTIVNEGEFTTASGVPLWIGMCSSTAITPKIIVKGDGVFTANGYLQIQRLDNAGLKSAVIVQDNGQLLGSGSIDVGYGKKAAGYLVLSNAASVVKTAKIRVGAGNGQSWGAQGHLSLNGTSRVEIQGNAWDTGIYLGAYNSTTINGSTGVVSVADNASVRSPFIELGAGKNAFGRMALTDSARVFVTNLYLATAKNGENSFATGRAALEVADSAAVAARSIAFGNGFSPATATLRGGTLVLNPATSNTTPLSLNAKCAIRGWGKVAFSEPRRWVTDNAQPCGFEQVGQVVADGEGMTRDLDFGRYTTQGWNRENNSCGTNGWFAVNKGRLKLPRSLPTRSGRICVGDFWTRNLSSNNYAPLCNTFNYTFAGAASGNFIFSELYAPDRDDIPGGIPARSLGKVVSVWRIGLFSDGPEADDPSHPAAFTSATLTFCFPKGGLDGLGHLYVFRHDGTIGGTWKRVAKAVVPSGRPLVSVPAFTPSAANWNMGWFAIVCTAEPYVGGTIMVLR